MPSPPSSVSVAGFKAQFAREFPYGTGTDKVMDGDITRAINEAASSFNGALFDSTETPIWFYYCAAHFLALNIQAAGGLNVFGREARQGVNSVGEGVLSGKGVGPVNQQFDGQDESLKSPGLAWFHKTEFGKKYIAKVSARSVGSVFAVPGPVEPDTPITFIPGLELLP